MFFMLPFAFLYEKANSKKFWSDTHEVQVTPIFHFSRTLAAHQCPRCTHYSQQHIAHIMEFSFSKKPLFWWHVLGSTTGWTFAAVHRQFGLTVRLFFPKNMVNVKFVSRYIKTKMPLNSLLTVVVGLIFKLSTLKSFQIKQLTLCISKNIKLIYENKNKHDQLLARLSYW